MAKKTTKRVGGLNLACMAKGFLSYKLRKEDDVKLHFYAEIMKPLVQKLNPNGVNDYCSENVLRAGGRTDATFQAISFEFKCFLLACKRRSGMLSRQVMARLSR